jgi:hypothetical protein
MAPKARPGAGVRFAAGPAAERTERTRTGLQAQLGAFVIACDVRPPAVWTEHHPIIQPAPVHRYCGGRLRWLGVSKGRVALTYAPLRHHALIDGELRPPAAGRAGAR